MKTIDERPRVVIMTDAEIDDRCSMIHALLYAYGQLLPNLRVHDSRYPSAEYLYSISTMGDEDETHIPKLSKPYKQIYTGEPSLIEPER